jgi:hypothetical protein
MKHFPKKELAYAVAVVALLAGLYVGGYYAMVADRDLVWLGPSRPTFVIVPVYRFGGNTANAIVAHLHGVDRQMRPEYWRGGDIVTD